MAPTYIYYRVYDANGIVDVKAPLPSEISNSKTIGRIMKSLIPPPFSVANVKLSIAQQEGYQGVFEARGAQLFTVSSQEQITEKNGLLKGAGLSMTSPLKLRFSGKLQRDMSAPFVGKWRHTKIGSNDTYRYKNSWQFTLRKAPGGKIAAAGYEHYTTTYTDFVDSGKASEESLPSPDKTTYELSNFKVVSESSISFTRTRSSDGATWKVSGDLGADGKWLTLTLKRAGSGVAPTARVFKRIV